MTSRPTKLDPRTARVVRGAEGACQNGAWDGSISAEALGTDAFLLFVNSAAPGDGPGLHVHPYDELFIVTEGRARFTVGDKTVDLEAGDTAMGPANVPHKYSNLGPGPLRTIDIHLNAEWIQTDLPDPEDADEA